jgi:hypothetical protein
MKERNVMPVKTSKSEINKTTAKAKKARLASVRLVASFGMSGWLGICPT